MHITLSLVKMNENTGGLEEVEKLKRMWDKGV